MENRTENGYCYSPLKEKYKLLGFEDRLGCCVYSPPDQDYSLQYISQHFESLKNKIMELA